MLYTSKPKSDTTSRISDNDSNLDGAKFYCSLMGRRSKLPNLIGQVSFVSLIAACSSPEETPLGFSGGNTPGGGNGGGNTPGGGDGGNGGGTTPGGGDGDGDGDGDGGGATVTIVNPDYTVTALVDIPTNINDPIPALGGGETSTLESSTDNMEFSALDASTKAITFSEDTRDSGKTFTLTHDTTTSIVASSSTSLGMLYAKIDGNSATDLILISSDINNGSGGKDGVVKIIWDYLDTVSAGMTSFFQVQADVNSAFSKQLIIKGSNNQNLGAISAGDATSPNLAFLDVDELDPALAINAPSANQGSIYIIWDIGSHNTAGANTLDLSGNGVLRITANISIGKQFEDLGLTRAIELDGDPKDDFLILSSGAQFGGTPVGALHIIWDIADHQSGTIEVNTTNPADVLSIYGRRNSGEFADEVKILDLDDDGINDIWVTDNREGFIFWGSALMDAAGQGKSGVINLGDTTTTTVDTTRIVSIDVFSGTVDGFTKAGLWFNTNNLNDLTSSFWFIDVEGDGAVEAVKKAPTGTAHDYWTMSSAKNVLLGDTSNPVPAASGNVSAADLLSKGIFATAAQNTQYAKQDVNEDGIDDLIERAPDADGNHKGHHKVWLGNASGTFDVTATPSTHEYVAVVPATPLEAAEDIFADQATSFEMIDVA